MCKSVHKKKKSGTKKRNADIAKKCEQKKEFCYTIASKSKNLEFPGKTELIDTITHGKEITKKVQKWTLKKRKDR